MSTFDMIAEFTENQSDRSAVDYILPSVHLYTERNSTGIVLS